MGTFYYNPFTKQAVKYLATEIFQDHHIAKLHDIEARIVESSAVLTEKFKRARLECDLRKSVFNKIFENENLDECD